ncbi:hypothetical protein OC835_002258 [Tilletia horrida]|uniref:Borealin N-terminal domain-containing protein n=1 Tax=Tilletia horrida TaxID=155126 RepID=A0AAN6GJN9_9BASI|nr:hypothetical protein OC835_002258 [Tilletia horrida]KAK0537667.1 hypothetical protein OC842_001542 [Tilletia horrida]KAK0566037.1 hypothetical protein OC844_000920 [Tilletia horrida]
MSLPQYLNSSTPPGSSSLLGVPGPSKTTKKRKAAGKSSAQEKENRAVAPRPGKTLTQDHVRSFLANFDLEAENRIRQLQRQLELSVRSAEHAVYLQLERVPSTVKEATVDEFLRQGNGKIRTFLASRPVKHLDQTQEEWERAKRRKAWDSADAPSSGAPSAEDEAQPPAAATSSGGAADSEASAKPVKKPPMSRKATGSKTGKAKAGGSGPSRLTRRTSVVLRTQQGDEFDVDTASTSQLEEMGLSEKDVTDLRAILLKLKA